MGYNQHIDNLTIDEINIDWIIKILENEFKNNDIITPIRILAKIGIPVGDQINQLKKKNYRLKLKKLLKELDELGLIQIKDNFQEIKGIRETGYKMK